MVISYQLKFNPKTIKWRGVLFFTKTQDFIQILCVLICVYVVKDRVLAEVEYSSCNFTPCVMCKQHYNQDTELFPHHIQTVLCHLSIVVLYFCLLTTNHWFAPSIIRVISRILSYTFSSVFRIHLLLIIGEINLIFKKYAENIWNHNMSNVKAREKIMCSLFIKFTSNNWRIFWSLSHGNLLSFQ